MNANVIILNTKVEIGSIVSSPLARKRATVLEFVDDKNMTIRWESDGSIATVARVAFVLG
jgi:hypothetical protein